MRGDGFKDIIKKGIKFISPVVKKVGPVAFKHFILPYFKKKYGFDIQQIDDSDMTLGYIFDKAGNHNNKPSSS